MRSFAQWVTRAYFSLLKDGTPKKVAYSADRFLASIPTLNLISENFLLLFVLKGFIDYLGKFFPMKNNNKFPNKRNITCYDVTK